MFVELRAGDVKKPKQGKRFKGFINSFTDFAFYFIFIQEFKMIYRGWSNVETLIFIALAPYAGEVFAFFPPPKVIFTRFILTLALPSLQAARD